MVCVTVGFAIGRVTSTKKSPIYKAIMDLDIGEPL